MNFKKNYKGMLLCLIIAIPCWFLGKKFPIVGGPVFGIILGMIITLFIKDKKCDNQELLLPQRRFYNMQLSY